MNCEADLPECHSDHYSRHRRNHFRVPGSSEYIMITLGYGVLGTKVILVSYIAAQHHAAGIDEFDGHDHDDTVVPKVSSTESLDEASTYATVVSYAYTCFLSTLRIPQVSWAACKDRQETYSCGRGGIFVHVGCNYLYHG